MSTWPFPNLPNVATFTVRQIISGKEPILFVSHDAEDGSWQFLTNKPLDIAEAMLVGLAEMLRHDATLAEIADLPEGWQATREHKGANWQRTLSSSA